MRTFDRLLSSVFLRLARWRTRYVDEMYERRVDKYVRSGFTYEEAKQRVLDDDNECYLHG